MFPPVLGVTVNTIGVPAGAEVGLALKLARALAPTVTVTEFAEPVVPDPLPVSPPAAPGNSASTCAVEEVDSVVVAIPFESVVAADVVSVPASVVNVIGKPEIGEPPSSEICAVMSDVPPDEGS